ncbi:MAG: FAD-dependent oxidoreductase [Candidatus Sumerlaeaceae bacterium]|nr:FAD-dependent oxidoreductase [Candidatus Sumerlaeaceae bacterium]
MTGPKLLVIGGVAGGASFAARARRLCEDATIILVERGPHVSFANCGLPYHIGGEIAERRKLLVQTPERLRAILNLDVRTNTEAVRIDRDRREVELRDLMSGRSYIETYDKLVLAPGAAPLRPPIPGIDREGHFTLRNIPDLESIMTWIESRSARRAVVVGGGYIGLETAEQLHRRGLEVAVAEALPQVMAPLDPEMAAFLHAELRANGIALHLGDPVAAFESPAPGESAAASVVMLKSGVRLPADIVILGLGVRPETDLARVAGLEIGDAGGIRVDEQMRTSDPNIFAVGDAVEVRDAATGAWTLIPLAGPANRQGRIAADAIFGLPSRYTATQGTAIIRVFGLAAGCTGANAKTLTRAGIPFEAIHLHPNSHAGYYPGAKPIALKVLFCPKSGKFLGAQAVGADGVDKRIDVLATALKAGMTVDDLAELELAYAPPFGSAKDPVNLAGMIAQNVVAGRMEVAQWSEVSDGADGAPFVLLDVREKAEVEAGRIPGSIHIPLGELRARLGELPRDREIIVHCQSGQRSYFASRILAQRGFRVRNLTGSYKTWKAAVGA